MPGSDAPAKPVPPLPKGFVRFVKLVFGKIEYVSVCPANTEERVRTKYRSEITELEGLGCEHLCCYGEAFSLARLAYVLPAITVLTMWLEGRPLGFTRAGRSWHAILCW